MADVTPNYIRGFMLPMDISEGNLWAAESSYSQQNPIAGDPLPKQSSVMRVIATGNQSATGSLTLKTRSAGVAGYGSGFTFTENNTSTTVEYGRDAPNTIAGFQYVRFALGVGFSDQYYYPTGISIDEGTILIASHKINTLSTNIAAVTKITTAGAVSDTNLYQVDGFLSATQYMHPTITKLKDGSIIIVHLVENAGEANVYVHRSLNGTDWTTISRNALSEAIIVGTATGAGVETYRIQRMRIASSQDQILLVIEADYNDTAITKRNRIFQYASIDGGGTFQSITSATNLASNSFHSIDLSVRNGQIVVSYCATKTSLHYMALPNAFSNIHLMRSAGEYVVVSTATVATNTDDYMQGGDNTIFSDESGSLFSIFLEAGAGNIIIKYSQDGSLWKWTCGNSSVDLSRLVYTNDASSIPKNINAFVHLGRSVMISNFDSSASNDNSLAIFYLGGYSTVTLPQVGWVIANEDWNRASYINSYVPLDEPSNIAGLNVAGTATDNLASGYLHIQSGARSYTFNNYPVFSSASIIEDGAIVRFSLYSTSGGSLTHGAANNHRGVLVKIDDGTSADYYVEFWLSETGFKIRDENGSVDIGSVVFDCQSGIDVILAISNNKLVSYYRALSNDQLRTWISGPTSTTLSNGGGSALGVTVEFGHLNYNSGTITTDWNECHVAAGRSTGLQITDFTNPDDLAPTPFPPLGQYKYIYDNVQVSTSDGYTYEGDEWDIMPRFDYPIENIFHSNSPSPRIQWRSTAVASGTVPSENIAFKFDPDLTNNNSDSFPNDLFGLHFSNVNWSSGTIYYYHSGSWISLGSILNRIDCSCVVQGRTARGAVGLTEPYFTFNELAGWTCYFIDGASHVYRKITSNTEGKFGGTATTTKQCVLTFDENPPQSSTTVYFIPPSFTLAISVNGKKAQGIKVQISTQQTYDNDLRIGHLSMGPIIVPGRQYSRGRTIAIESGSETIVGQDGIRYSKEYRPAERVYRLAWTEGVDISNLQGEEPDPDYWVSSNQPNAEPIAVLNEVPDLMMNVLSYLQGSVKPIVYLPNISKSTTASKDFRRINRKKEHALVTLDSDIEIQSIVGDELQGNNSGEVFRIATITLREIV